LRLINCAGGSHQTSGNQLLSWSWSCGGSGCSSECLRNDGSHQTSFNRLLTWGGSYGWPRWCGECTMNRNCQLSPKTSCNRLLCKTLIFTAIFLLFKDTSTTGFWALFLNCKEVHLLRLAVDCSAPYRIPSRSKTRDRGIF
jgi:hypothetical protein